MRKLIYNTLAGVIGTAVVFVIALFLMRAAYPKKYTDIVRKYADRYGVSEELIYAVIRCESGFKSDAVSSAGAVGLMQLTYDTVCWAAGRYGENVPDKSSLYIPQTNIKYGVAVYALLEGEFGDTGVSLAAYNAGRSRVLKWLGDARCSDDGILLKAIPFPETENYVDKVLKTMKIYKIIY